MADIPDCIDYEGSDLGRAIKIIMSASIDEKLSYLKYLLGRAAYHRTELESILQIACIITGEGTDNSLTSEAVLSGNVTAERLLRA